VVSELESLRQFCTTERQSELLQALIDEGSERKAAAALGVTKNRISQTVRTLRDRAAKAGVGPHYLADPIPPGYKVKGTSTYYGPDGIPRGQWVKTREDAQAQLEAMQEAVQALCEDVPRLAPVKPPAHSLSTLLNVYTMTDCHIGMMAWRAEGGEDWDLKIAERTLSGCFDAMVRQAPAAQTCVIAQLGDWLHYDSLESITPTGKNLLDSDGRFAKMVEVSVRVLRGLVSAALEKHENVILLCAEGNHDLASSVWLRTMFAALYEKESRVHVIRSECPYYAYQHGETMLVWHHGHLKKPDALPLLAATQFPVIWGNTRKRYGHLGDKHHLDEKEHSGMIVRQHPTLAARDAYASRHGWHALRAATGITYHNVHGEVARNTVYPEMLD
jgi:hypothetical protein